ncbi:MAG: flavodoxin [Clostridia bacterium]|nr:flavodoxin [Clostridia bacterium]
MVKKIFIGIFILIAVMVGCLILTVLLVASASKPKGDREEILKSTEKKPKKALIVYQPAVSDITYKMAQKIAKGLNDGGYEVILNCPGEHLPNNTSGFSVVVFGSPSYGGKPLTVLTDYMSRINDFSSSRIVLFSTGANPKTTEIDLMESFLKDRKPVKKIKFPVGEGKENENTAYKLGVELSKE